MSREPVSRSSTARRHREIAIKAAEWIEQNREQPPALAVLAQQAGLSPFHFQRIFTQVIGESPSRYARRRRLERSAYRLLRQDVAVTEVAFDAGYEAHESFTRAFRSRFAQAPAEFSRRAALRRRECPALPFDVVSLPRIRLACVPHVGPYDDAGVAFERLVEWAAPRGLLDGQDLLGVYYDDQVVTRAQHTRSLAGLPIADGVEVGDGIDERILEPGRYARLLHHPSAEAPTVRETFELCFRDWFPRSGWRPDTRPMVVQYHGGVGDPATLFLSITR